MLDHESQIRNTIKTMEQDPPFKAFVEKVVGNLVRNGQVPPGRPIEEILGITVDAGSCLARVLLSMRDSVNDTPSFVQALRSKSPYMP